MLAIGAIIVFSASVGAFSQTWLISTGYYRHRMIVYGLWAAGAFTIGVGLLPVVALAALVRPKGVPWTRELRDLRRGHRLGRSSPSGSTRP